MVNNVIHPQKNLRVNLSKSLIVVTRPVGHQYIIMMRLANNHVENFDYIDERMENNHVKFFRYNDEEDDNNHDENCHYNYEGGNKHVENCRYDDEEGK